MCATEPARRKREATEPRGLESALAALAAMPAKLGEIVAAVPPALWRKPPAAGGFALVEHVCHLCDIECEGYRARLERMLAEEAPFLADLDGARLARERDYPSADLRAALRAFTDARRAVVERLRALAPAELRRSGLLEGVGAITIEGLVAKMREHDGEHLDELHRLREELVAGTR